MFTITDLGQDHSFLRLDFNRGSVRAIILVSTLGVIYSLPICNKVLSQGGISIWLGLWILLSE